MRARAHSRTLRRKKGRVVCGFYVHKRRRRRQRRQQHVHRRSGTDGRQARSARSGRVVSGGGEVLVMLGFAWVSLVARVGVGGFIYAAVGDGAVCAMWCVSVGVCVCLGRALQSTVSPAPASWSASFPVDRPLLPAQPPDPTVRNRRRRRRRRRSRRPSVACSHVLCVER